MSPPCVRQHHCSGKQYEVRRAARVAVNPLAAPDSAGSVPEPALIGSGPDRADRQ